MAKTRTRRVDWTGARNLTGVMYTVARLALDIRSSLESAESDGVRLRLVRQFLMDAEQGDVAVLVSEIAPPTGSADWDALLAGIAEYAAHGAGVRTPPWSVMPERFLRTWFFVMPYEALHGHAIAETPAALANRGVFIRRAALVNA